MVYVELGFVGCIYQEIIGLIRCSFIDVAISNADMGKKMLKRIKQHNEEYQNILIQIMFRNRVLRSFFSVCLSLDTGTARDNLNMIYIF